MNEEKNVKIILSILVIALLGFGIFLYFDQKLTPGTYTYIHGTDTFDIQQIGTTEDGGITYKIKIFLDNDPSPKYISTRHEPKEMDGLKLDERVKQNILTKKEIYLIINPNEGLTGKTTIAALELDKFLDNAYLFKIPVKSAFTEEYENSKEYPIKTCNDVTKETGIIWLKLGEETVIKDENGCIILEGQTEDDLIKLADGLIFYLMGMIK